MKSHLKNCVGTACVQRGETSSSTLDSNYSSLFSTAGSINQIDPPPPSPACSQSTVF